jgi:hypothetical protein
MMKRLALDFRRSGHGSPWLGRVVLAVAAAVCIDAALTYKSLHGSVRQSEIRVAKRAPSGAVAKVTAAEVAVVRETVQRLSLPWDELFMALESAASDKVALAAIEPDTAKGTVTITADGKDYLAALSYVSNLSRIEGLERVELVRHERKTPDPNSPVSFAVSAAWSTR